MYQGRKKAQIKRRGRGREGEKKIRIKSVENDGTEIGWGEKKKRQLENAAKKERQREKGRGEIRPRSERDKGGKITCQPIPGVGAQALISRKEEREMAKEGVPKTTVFKGA